MTIKEARKAILKAGGSWKKFEHWMEGQTIGLNPDGSSNYYDYDVNRFIKYKCGPKNEPASDYD